MDRSRVLGAYVAVGGLMAVLDATVTAIALPRLVTQFHVDLSTVQWVTTGYALAMVAVMPTAAWAMARFGARATYVAALGAFTAGSAMAGLAWDLDSLILWRVLQGLGGGLLGPVGMAVALREAPPERRGALMSVLGLPMLIGPVIGPVLGGVLVDDASWRWIFWINVPLGLAALAMGRRLLPGAHDDAVGALDRVGLLQLCPGVALLVLGLSSAGGRGTLLTPTVLGPVLLGGAMVGAFVRHARRTADPLLQLQVLRVRATGAATAALFLFSLAYYGSSLIGPAYVQLIRGDSATLAGMLGIAQAVSTGLSLQVATRLVDRLDPRLVVGAGVTITALATAARALVLRADTAYPLLVALGAVAGVGVGATLMPVMTAATRPLRGADLRAGTTLLSVASQLALASGTAVAAAALSWLAGVLAPALGPHALSTAATLPVAARLLDAPALVESARWVLVGAVAVMGLAGLAVGAMPAARRGHAASSRAPSTARHDAELTPAVPVPNGATGADPFPRPDAPPLNPGRAGSRPW